MAEKYCVTATFKDFKGNRSTVKVNNPVGVLNFTTMGDAKAFATGLAGWSRAGLVSYSSVGTEIVDEYPDSFGIATTQAGEHYDLVQQKLTVYYRDKPSGRIISVSIPAPADKCFDAAQNPKGDLLEDLADLIGKCTNFTSSNLNPIKGGLKSKLPKHQDFLVKTGV